MPMLRLSDGANINYFDSGNPHSDCPTLLFVHGWGVSGAAYEHQKQLGEEFRIIIIDNRGCGLSDCGTNELSVGQIGKDIFEIINILKLSNVHIIGWSMGAMALWLAMKGKIPNSVKSVAFIDMSPKISNEADWPHGILGHQSLSNEIGIERLEKAINSMNANWNQFAKRMVSRIFSAKNTDEKNPKTMIQISQLLTVAERNNPHNMGILWNSLAHCDARKILGKIQMPCLLIYGQDNQLYAANLGEVIEGMIKDSILVSFENCGHAPHIEQADEFNKILSRFVSTIHHDKFRGLSNEEGNGSFLNEYRH